MTDWNPVSKLGEAIIELADEDSRKSRRNRIDAVVQRYGEMLASFRVATTVEEKPAE